MADRSNTKATEDWRQFKVLDFTPKRNTHGVKEMFSQTALKTIDILWIYLETESDRVRPD
jgi:hypothetical protein